MRELSVPYVLIGRECDEVPSDSVSCDDRAAGPLAGEYLLGSGCKRVLYIGPTGCKARLTGFSDCAIHFRAPMPRSPMCWLVRRPAARAKRSTASAPAIQSTGKATILATIQAVIRSAIPAIIAAPEISVVPSFRAAPLTGSRYSPTFWLTRCAPSCGSGGSIILWSALTRYRIILRCRFRTSASA